MALRLSGGVRQFFELKRRGERRLAQKAGNRKPETETGNGKL